MPLAFNFLAERERHLMKKLFAAGAVGIGLILFVIGLGAYLSPLVFGSRTLAGLPSDQALWLAIGGLLACISGIFSLADSHAKQSESDTAHFHR
jgi:hypothetical protein